MPRPPRIEVPRGFYHLVSRGNNRHPIYFADRDCEDFLGILARVVERHAWLCFAYCLMTNHYHLVIQLDEGGLSRGMQTLNGWFARTMNGKYGRGGHLFHNRFGSTLLEDESHLFAACRYVVLNPVRAGLCGRPEHWRWSSYRACAGLAPVPPLLASAELLALFAADPRQAQARYREFVMAGIDTHGVRHSDGAGEAAREVRPGASRQAVPAHLVDLTASG